MDENATNVTYRSGRAVVTKVHESSLAFPAAKLLPDREAQGGDSRDGPLTLNVHSWLVRVDGMTVLVDAGIGNGKRRAVAAFDGLDTPWLARLAAAGARPEDVTHVLLTHLHTDHVGWNTVPGPGGWVPTFPNAVTVMPLTGYRFFTSPQGRARPNHDMFADSVVPIVEAGRVRFVGPDEAEPVPGFTFIPTPGHSIDHMSILLRSEDREALFAGDVLHHPDQVAHPNLCSMFCERPDEARRSRRRMLDLAADSGLTWFSSHCTGTSTGRVRRTVDGFAWSFV